MADGILCIHCGWQETDHVYGEIEDPQDAHTIFEGRTHCLLNCYDFEPEDPSLAAFYKQIEQEKSALIHAQSEAQARVLPMLYKDILPTLLLIARSKR